LNWLGFSLMAASLWGLWGFLSKVATLQLPISTVYLFSIVGHLAVISYLAGTGELGICWHPGGLAAALGAGICMAFGLLYFFKALAEGPTVGVVVPLTALYPLVTVILSWTLLREGFSLRQLAGVALALPAVWLMSK
jgi:transporter family protein